MKYTTLLFDADGTLYDFKKTENEALKSFYEHYRIPCPFEEFVTVYKEENKKLWILLEEDEVTPENIKIERFTNTMKALGLNHDKSHEMSQYFIEALANGEYLLDGAYEMVSALPKDYEMFIITNGLWDVQKKRIGQSDLYEKHFKGMVVSDKVGVGKPSPKIFDEMFKVAENPEKSDVLIIGDNLNSDIKGGKLYGIDTCWYNPSDQEFSGDYKPTYTVQSFQELQALLSKNFL